MSLICIIALVSVAWNLCSTGEVFEEVLLASSKGKGIWAVSANDEVNASTRHVFSSKGNSNPTAFDPYEQQVYWLEYRKHENTYTLAKRSLLDGLDYFLARFKTLLVRGMSLDWVERRLFYIQEPIRSYQSHNQILYVNLDGSNRQDLVYETDAVAMSLDLFNSYLYWISEDNYILVTRTDKTYVATVVQAKCSHQCSFIVDYQYSRMYWSSSSPHIEVANVDGSARYTIYTDSLSPITALDVTGDLMYWGTKNEIRLQNVWDNTSTPIYHLPKYLHLTKLEKAILRYTEDDNKICSSYHKCVGNREPNTCLDSSTVCDGKDDCYGGHDEIYCFLCGDVCFVETFFLVCHSGLPEETISNIADISELIDWDTHPLSKFIQLGNLLSSQCRLSLKIAGYGTEYKGLIFFQFHKLSVPRVFRQVMSSKTFRKLNESRELNLSGNYFPSEIKKMGFTTYNKLKVLSITYTRLSLITTHSFSGLDILTDLNISYNKITQVKAGSFDRLVSLLSIDMRGNRIPLITDLFLKNTKLIQIYSNSFTFCCFKPDWVLEENCVAPEVSLSNCSDLIKNNVLKVFLWVVGFLALVVNIFALFLHKYKVRKSKQSIESFHVFVCHLSIADTLMGVYMLAIAVHDIKFKGKYAANQFLWTNGIACKSFGIIAMTSSESSVLLICLITLDRFLAVKFPFKSIEISRWNARTLCAFVWLISTAIAVTPAFLYDEFYSKSGVCMALPKTTHITDDFAYSASIFLGLNFILFLVVVFGQIAIYKSVQKSSLIISEQQKERNKMVAKLLFVVAMTDALCWIPIAMIGIVSLCGVPVPDAVCPWAVVLVLPMNSAINPFIYTLLTTCRSKSGTYGPK